MSCGVVINLASKDAWTRARDRFIEGLDNEEAAIYQDASLETIFYDASAAEKKHGATSTTRRYVEKLQPLVDAIDQYGRALDVYANTYALVMCPLWGSVRVVLHLAGESAKYYDKLLDMFAQIGDVLPRFRVYERLFPDHERLIQALSLVYVDILNFCTQARAVFRRGRRASLVTLTAALKLVWKPFNSQFGEVITSFRSHRKTVEKEAGLSHMIESAYANDSFIAHKLQVDRERKENERRRLLTILSPVNYQAKQNALRALRCEGTAEWIFCHPSFTAWRKSPQNQGLCCRGIPGSGKTILASSITDSLLNASKKSAPICLYHYCDYAVVDTLLPVHIIGSLLKQRIVQGIEPTLEDAVARVCDNGYDGQDVHGLSLFLREAVESPVPTYIIIDGLDECAREDARSLLALLESVMATSKTSVKVLVTCRDEDETVGLISHFPQICLSESVLAADLACFVDQTVKASIEEGKLRRKSMQHEIISQLTSKAHGMFLWVHFQLVELCEAASDAEAREILADLPDGLEGTYGRILLKISKSQHKQKRAMKLFRWIACAKRPLSLKEIQEAAVIEDTHDHWIADSDHIPDIDAVLEACHALVIRDPQGNSVRFAHHTVLQYLTAAKGSSPADLASMFFSLNEANIMVGRLCIAYLSFSDFETALTRRGEQTANIADVLRKSEPRMIPTTVGIPKPMFQIPFRLLGGNNLPSVPNIDINIFLGRKPYRHHRSLVEKYALLGYVVRYWADHTQFIRATDPPYGLFRTLVLDKQLPFEFRPWGADRHYGEYGCLSCPILEDSEPDAKDLPHVSLLHWAAQSGHESLFAMPELLPYLHHERDTQQTLRTACRYGKHQIVRNIRNAADDRYTAIDSRMIDDICTYGHDQLLRDLIPFIDHLETSKRVFKRVLISTGLASAAKYGHTSVVQILLEYGSHIEAYDIMDALHYACENSFQETAIMLHDFIGEVHEGAILDSPLIHAARAGRLKMVQFLLKIGSITPSYSSKPLLLDDNRIGVASFFNFQDMLVPRPAAIHWATAEGHHEVLRALACHPPYMESIDLTAPFTPLHIACIFKQEEAARTLIDCDVCIDTADNEGRRALHYAACYGQSTLVEALIGHAASPNVTDKFGLSPLMYAVGKDEESQIKCIELLLEANANTRFSDSRGAKALHMAAESMNPRAVMLLLDKDRSLLATEDYTGCTPLHYAALKDSRRMVETFMTRGPDIRAQTHKLQTPLHCAIKNGNLETATTLLEYGASLLARDVQDVTALHMAASLWDGPQVGRMIEHSPIIRRTPALLALARRLHHAKKGPSKEAIINQLEEDIPQDVADASIHAGRVFGVPKPD